MARRYRTRKGRGVVFKVALLLALAVAIAPLLVVAAYRVVPPPMTPLMIIRLIEGHGIERSWVPLSKMSPSVVHAVIAAEDNLFCSHAGFDWDAMLEAISEHRRGGRLRGASTITMQTAKNVFLWPGRSFVRKVLEAYMTLLIEFFWDKRRIIEVYLNVAEWGPGIYGVEAASRHYFDKPAARLKAREGALLAAVLPNPRKWSPVRPTAFVLGRAQVYQRRAAKLGRFLDCVPGRV